LQKFAYAQVIDIKLPGLARLAATLRSGEREPTMTKQPDRLMALDRWGAEFARVADLSRRMSHTRREARKISLDTPRFPQP
jgi:hypothetical protein